MGTVAAMYEDEIAQFGGVLVSAVSTTDINRNKIVDTLFKETSAEWLWWLDSDNPPPAGSLRRLLGVGEPLVSGLYYGGDTKTDLLPVAYLRKPEGTYVRLDEVYQWERGEIVQVDSVGMGCFLTHRSVYEDIQNNFVMLQRKSGGITAVHKDKIHGDVLHDAKHPYEGQVRKSTLYDPVIPITNPDFLFPYFVCQYTRTEDYWFCEMVRELGYTIWLDTSVEATHLKPYGYSGEDFRKQHGLSTEPGVRSIVYV
jgi:hypothetical protein